MAAVHFFVPVAGFVVGFLTGFLVVFLVVFLRLVVVEGLLRDVREPFTRARASRWEAEAASTATVASISRSEGVWGAKISSASRLAFLGLQ